MEYGIIKIDRSFEIQKMKNGETKHGKIFNELILLGNVFYRFDKLIKDANGIKDNTKQEKMPECPNLAEFLDKSPLLIMHMREWLENRVDTLNKLLF